MLMPILTLYMWFPYGIDGFM